MTTIVPGHRTALGRHRRELEVILASAPPWLPPASPALRHDDDDRCRANPAPNPAVMPDGRDAAEPGQQM